MSNGNRRGHTICNRSGIISSFGETVIETCSNSMWSISSTWSRSVSSGSNNASCWSDSKRRCKHVCRCSMCSCSSSHTMLCLLALVALVDRRYRLHTRLPPLGALRGLPPMGVAPKHIVRRYRVSVRRAR